MIDSHCFCVFVLLIYTFILFTQTTESENFPLFEKRGLDLKSRSTYFLFFLLLTLFSPRRWGRCNRTCNNATWWAKLRTAPDSSQKAGGDVGSLDAAQSFPRKLENFAGVKVHTHEPRTYPPSLLSRLPSRVHAPRRLLFADSATFLKCSPFPSAAPIGSASARA